MVVARTDDFHHELEALHWLGAVRTLVEAVLCGRWIPDPETLAELDVLLRHVRTEYERHWAEGMSQVA
jgi:hypothetical protein